MSQKEDEMAEPDLKLPPPNISRVKNKQIRAELYRKQKRAKRKEKMEVREAREREAKALGKNAPPKQIPKTIENMRVKDETMVDPADEEVMHDEAIDELSSYFRRETQPKILLTTCDKPRGKTLKLCFEMSRVMPNWEFKFRRGFDLKKVIPKMMKLNYTHIIVVNEDQKEPNGMVISHLPDGPTAHFKMSSVRLASDIKRAGKMSKHRPEVILNNFNTRLGHSIGRLIATMFPHDPQFNGRRAITFHNQRDFVFFRHHRYVFRNSKKVGLQELGPRFTLKLRSLQKGVFDSKYGEYEWVHKRHEMETNRRKFFL